MLNESDVGVASEASAAVSSYALGIEDDIEGIDVYRRYLKNLNYSSLNISAVHSFAKLLFAENSSSTSFHSLSSNRSFDESFEVPKHYANNNKFDVSNSEVVLIVLTVIYVLIFITGVTGNVVTCVVIFQNKGMHTAVNYYLFSLAVSDLLLLISGKCVVICQRLLVA